MVRQLLSAGHPDCLDCAWRDIEREMPGGWAFAALTRIAVGSAPIHWRASVEVTRLEREGQPLVEVGESAAEALTHLAESLSVERAARRDPEGSDAPLHALSSCVGEHCPHHDPSPGPHARLPIRLVLDYEPLAFRLCPDGIEHPDPDSVAALERLDRRARPDLREHACDGCCGLDGAGA